MRLRDACARFARAPRDEKEDHDVRRSVGARHAPGGWIVAAGWNGLRVLRDRRRAGPRKLCAGGYTGSTAKGSMEEDAPGVDQETLEMMDGQAAGGQRMRKT
ncbi:hypothetical protein ACIBI9_64330 [Nonomuraea sp. NPDC050451]|uniref:hypothetical protein n=1 Tax=Nonomuraea sp. NPDC050451 TaxID=3364364 RepID=UPI003791589F